MEHAEERRTTSTGVDSGLSGPQSRLGRRGKSKPPTPPQPHLNRKKPPQLCQGWVAGLSVSLWVPDSLMHCCLIRPVMGEALPAPVGPDMTSHYGSGNLDAFHSEGADE